MVHLTNAPCGYQVVQQFRLMKACHPHLRPGSVVINLGSSAVVNPLPACRGVYGAAMPATQAMTTRRSLYIGRAPGVYRGTVSAR